jgi:hypothetical protein
MKIFLRFILIFIPIPLLIISVNCFVDPANILSKEYEKCIANYLVEGNNVTDVVNYNERLLQKYFIENMKECPEVITLGSSRIMQISSVFLKENKFINNGVSGASLEDDLAIFYLYEKRGCKIKKVILGIDPWLLNDNNEQFRWKDIQNEYFDFSGQQLKQKINPDYQTKLYDYIKYKELLSGSYFKSSLQFLLKGLNKKYKPTKSIENKGFTRLIDGSIYYDEAYRNASFSEIERKALRCVANQPIYSLGKFTVFSERYKATFNKFIEYLQKQGIEVEFFLSPYHPVVFDYFKKNKYYHIVFKSEDYFREVAFAHNIKVIGSYDPGKYSFDNSYFYDGLHCSDKAINKILEINN